MFFLFVGGTVLQWLAPLPQNKVSCVKFACSLCACMAFAQDKHLGLTVNTKCVNVSVTCCMAVFTLQALMLNSNFSVRSDFFKLMVHIHVRKWHVFISIECCHSLKLPWTRRFHRNVNHWFTITTTSFSRTAQLHIFLSVWLK